MLTHVTLTLSSLGVDTDTQVGGAPRMRGGIPIRFQLAAHELDGLPFPVGDGFPDRKGPPVHVSNRRYGSPAEIHETEERRDQIRSGLGVEVLASLGLGDVVVGFVV